MGNKSFSLAVLPLHRFISILIFMYLEKCFFFFFFFFFCFVCFLFLFFFFFFLFFRKITSTRKIIFLNFTMSVDLCKRNNNKE